MASSRRRSRSGALLALSLSLSVGAVAHAQSRPLADLVADLGSPGIETREEAMRILVSDPALTLRQLEAQLESPSLSPEQRCRLLQAAKQRFMESPRPAMGVQFDSQLPDRVAIETVYDNFPATGILKPGDLIVACQGEKLRSRAAWVRLGAHIFSREPGDSVELEIRRGAEKLHLTVPLGSFANLQSRAGPGEERLEHAWELRSRRYRPDAATPIVVNIPIDEWRQEPTAIEVQKLARFRDQLPQGATARVIAGGEARGGVLDYEELITMARQNPDFAMAGNRAWAAARLQQQMFALQTGGAIMQTTKQEISALETRRIALEKQLEVITRAGTLTPELVQATETTAQTYREHLARVKLQIEAIKAEAAEEEAQGAVGQ